DQAAEFNQQANTFLELTRMLQKIDELQETEASEISEEDNVVKMMTVHGSKGLEFNIVFLVNNDFSERDEERVFFPLAENDSGRYIYIKKFLEKLSDNPEFGLKIQNEDFKELMKELEAEVVYDETELLRKLYVAITRAREMLFIVTIPDSSRSSSKESSSKKFIDPSKLSITRFSQIDIPPEQIESFLNETVEESGKERYESVQIVDKKVIEAQISDLTNMAYKRYISPTLLYNIVDEKSDVEVFDENYNDFEGESFTQENVQKSQSGEVQVPNVFLSMLETSPELLEGKSVHRKISSVVEYNQLIYLVERGDLPNGILNADILKWLFEGSQKILSEWRIAKDMEENGKNYVLFGVPDKVFFKDGKIYVVDFKHSLLNRQQELDKYRFQVQFYMHLLADFGEIGGGYLISTKSGKVVEIQKPDDDFVDDVKRRIDKFLEVAFI
ncbi:MAG: 3'-5' exonuclease, partial [Fervidobacterium sp.]